MGQSHGGECERHLPRLSGLRRRDGGGRPRLGHQCLVHLRRREPRPAHLRIPRAVFQTRRLLRPKSALFNLTRYLATYWAAKNVRVNTLVLAGVFNHQDERFLAGYNARLPMGRMADEGDYNGAIIFLLSDASRYMTGSTVTIDGGWTAW